MNYTSWNLIGAILTTLVLMGLIGSGDNIAAREQPTSPVSTADPLLAKASPTPTLLPTATPAPTPTPTTNPSPTPTPTASPTPTATPQPSPSPISSPTPTAALATVNPSPSPQSSPSSMPTVSPTPTDRPRVENAIANFIQPPSGLLNQPVMQPFYQSSHITWQGTLALASLGFICSLVGVGLLWGQQIRHFFARDGQSRSARSLYYRLTTFL